jgi:hypothetical protein
VCYHPSYKWINPTKIPFSLHLPGPGLMVAIYFRDRRDGLDVLNGAMVDENGW